MCVKEIETLNEYEDMPCVVELSPQTEAIIIRSSD